MLIYYSLKGKQRRFRHVTWRYLQSPLCPLYCVQASSWYFPGNIVTVLSHITAATACGFLCIVSVPYLILSYSKCHYTLGNLECSYVYVHQPWQPALKLIPINNTHEKSSTQNPSNSIPSNTRLVQNPPNFVPANFFAIQYLCFSSVHCPIASCASQSPCYLQLPPDLAREKVSTEGKKTKVTPVHKGIILYNSRSAIWLQTHLCSPCHCWSFWVHRP